MDKKLNCTFLVGLGVEKLPFCPSKAPVKKIEKL